jgi:hypothetical protein
LHGIASNAESDDGLHVTWKRDRDGLRRSRQQERYTSASRQG